MDLDTYNRSFERLSQTFDEESENRIRAVRQECVRSFIDRLKRRQHEWDSLFYDFLNKSQEEDLKPRERTIEPIVQSQNLSGDSSFLKPSVFGSPLNSSLKETTKENLLPSSDGQALNLSNKSLDTAIEVQQDDKVKPTAETKPQSKDPKEVQNDQFTSEEFSNTLCLREFIRIQEILENNRKSFEEIVKDPRYKSFKNELNLFIKTQINSISNSDPTHLETKIRQLTDLFAGKRVVYQDRLIDASQHPMGQLYAMDYAAQTFVTVGARVVNSVPAIARSMAIVINGIAQNNNNSHFRDLLIGNLQECCPYLIPMQPNIKDYATGKDQEVRYKVACGYSCDTKTQTLETDEKYYLRMRSMVLLYACILVEGPVGKAWSWLASFLSLHPEPVISALVLQAFLQEASKKMSSIYGVQYKKLIDFLRSDYIKMVEDKTTKESDRQSLVKLKNLLSNNSNLIAAPSVSSIFGAVRMQ